MGEWWRNTLIYEIYPRSFQDSNADGVGDFNGIISRLDYLVWLGIGAIWICPFFPSPMRDGGYDISDFCAVDPRYGSLDDFDRLIDAAHSRGIRVVLDFVPNHTSDQHPWFQESRSSRSNPKRDWYIWRDGGPVGAPPSNWQSKFGGSAWTHDAETGQYYYHAFLPSQPDLNWRNPQVRAAMHDVLRFWIARGVDGYRVDAIITLVEDELLRDNPCGGALGRVFTEDRPETHAYVAEMRSVLDESGRDLVFIGEAHLPVARLMSYYGKKGFELPFNFMLLHTEWNARSVEAAIDRYNHLLPDGACPNWVLGNHDESRIATRVGARQARIAAMLLMTLDGASFVYYGDELGLEDTQEVSEGFERDGARSPMPWSRGETAGFTAASPWLPLSTSNSEKSAECLRKDERSILHLYKKLIALKAASPALASGAFSAVACRGDLLGYRRVAETSELLVLLNFGEQPATHDCRCKGEILISTELDRSEDVNALIKLRPYEGLVIELALS